MIKIEQLKQTALQNSLFETHKVQRTHCNLSYFEQFKLGCYTGGLSFFSKPILAITALAITIITHTCNYLFYSQQEKEKNESNANTFLQNVVILPIATEILFRGLIQNGLRQIQELTKSHSTSSLSQSKMMTSSMTTILAPNMLLALFTAQKSYLQAAFVALYPTGSILHFITGDKICAPIAANITSSFIFYTLFNLYNLVASSYFV